VIPLPSRKNGFSIFLLGKYFLLRILVLYSKKIFKKVFSFLKFLF